MAKAQTKHQTSNAPKPRSTRTKRPSKKSRFSTPVIARAYALLALATLFVTTSFWAVKSAGIQLSNADQLINPYLFENARTLQGALFPNDHTFLLKWPLFYLIKLLSFTSTAYTSITVGVVMITIAGLVLIMYRIERRPYVFGTLCLALAATLLLVPAQPYAGALLPVNMAMLATRNIEYIIYIAALICLIRAPRLKSWWFALAVGSLSILIASDKLFLVLTLGGALLSLMVYALVRNWFMVRLSAYWAVGSLLAALGALGMVGLLQANKVAHFVSASVPYNLAHSIQNLTLGALYSLFDLFTNFGANPAYDSTVVHNILHQFFQRLASVSGPALLVNALVVVGGIYAIWRIVRSSFVTKHVDTKLAAATQLTLMLIGSTITALGVFVVISHYYAVDARYLSIAFFTLFIAAATYTRQHNWPTKFVIIAGFAISVGILFGIPAANRMFSSDRLAFSDMNTRNVRIAQALQNRHTQLLVGDYWRVVPIKFQTNSQQQVVPLASCTAPRDNLNSLLWQTAFKNHSFAYLLTFDQSLSDYPHCSVKQVIEAYGRPNASVLIAGTLKQPKELLLYYDNGVRKSTPLTRPPAQGPATIVPINLQQLPYTPCNIPTIVTVVAHQDDDLLFMNPDILHDLQAGYCLRTIYVTAGDGGNNSFYWLSREQGSEAAYATMLGVKNAIWVQRIVELSSNEFVTIASLRDNPKVTLVFMHLPDGNLQGQGFQITHFESLAQLEANRISQLHSVDGQSVYSASQLADALNSFMHLFQPTEIYTQANYVSRQFPDHSDHMAVGRIVQKAYSQYETEQYANAITIPLKLYIGYPIHERPANISVTDLQQKAAAYFAYSLHDSGVCHSMVQCNDGSTFGIYLRRQYQNAN